MSQYYFYPPQFLPAGAYAAPNYPYVPSTPAPTWYLQPTTPPVVPAASALPATPINAATGMLTNPSFVKGALIGGAALYLLSNEAVQQSTIKGAVKAWSLVQGGIEEMKERFRDAEAEIHAEHATND